MAGEHPLIVRGWVRGHLALPVLIAVSLASAALGLVLVSFSLGSSTASAVFSIVLAAMALAAAFLALNGRVRRARRAEKEHGSSASGGPIYAVNLEQELWRMPREEVSLVGDLDLILNVLDVIPPVDQLWVLTGLPMWRNPEGSSIAPTPGMRRVMALQRKRNVRVRLEPNPIGGGVIQLGGSEMLVALPELSRSKSRLPAVWLALRPESNLALFEELTLDLAQRWNKATVLEPGEFDDDDLDWTDPAW